MKGALEGIRILDLARVAAGPYCGALFADMGAEVVKTEKRGQGDDFRLQRATGKDFNIIFYGRNRNKYGIELDFRAPKGKEILQQIAAKSDVVVENYRAGTISKMGLSEEELQEINPGLVVVSISGFGQDGPLCHKTSYDPLAQMASGVTSMVGTPDGGPNLIGYIAGDMTAGLYGAIGGMAALLYKNKTGIGQRVDISMLDVMASILVSSGVVGEYSLSGLKATGNGNQDRFVCPSNTFMAKDRLFLLDCRNDNQFYNLVDLMDMKNWAEENNLWENSARMEKRELVERVVAEWIRGQQAEEVEGKCLAANIPCAVVREAVEASEMQIVKDRELMPRMDFPDYPGAPIAGISAKLSETPGGLYRRTPELGENTEEILERVLGMTHEQVAELVENKIV